MVLNDILDESAKIWVSAKETLDAVKGIGFVI